MLYPRLRSTSSVLPPTPHSAEMGSGCSSATVSSRGTTSRPSGLARPEASFATNFVAAAPTEQTSPVSSQHAGAQERRDLHRRPEHGARAGDVEERLVDAEPLDVRGQVVADRHDLVRVVDVAVEVGRQHDGVRAPPQRDRHRHRRVHAIRAGLVGRRGHHRSRRWMPHDHRLALELRVIEQLDGREECVHVHVQDGRGRVVHRPGGDLPVASILLAHGAILPSAFDRAGHGHPGSRVIGYRKRVQEADHAPVDRNRPAHRSADCVLRSCERPERHRAARGRGDP